MRPLVPPGAWTTPAVRRVLLTAALIVAVAMPSFTQGRSGAGVPAPVRRVLAGQFGFSESDIDAAARGGAVVRAPETPDDREVAAVGVIKVNVPPAFYAAQLRDIVSFKRHEAVRQIGDFARPAQPADLAGLTLDSDHLEALRRCTPAACELHLSAEAIEDAHRTIPWGQPGAVDAAQAWFRRTLATLVRAYQTRGDTALMTYVDGGKTLSSARQFQALVRSPPQLLAAYPTLQAHVTLHPQGRSPSIVDVPYWSKEEIGPEEVISVTHMAIATMPPASAPVAFVAASRQIYASSLFEASLGLTVMIDDPSASDQMYLVYANRSRVDAIGGILGPIKRMFVRSRARSALADTLARAEASVERRYAQAGTPASR